MNVSAKLTDDQPDAALPVAAPPPQQALARGLYADLTALRAELVRQADARMAGWAPAVRDLEFLPSVENMADWLALRQADMTALQAPLASLGLSTLGRLDGHVRASLDAVIATLAVIAGDEAGDAGRDTAAVYPAACAFSDGADLLTTRRDAMFGAGRGGPQTRIMVTLPSEAASDQRLIQALVREGADCFRINCAHDAPKVWAAMIGHIRAAEAEFGRRVPVSMDLGGPKFRVQEVSDGGKHRFAAGDSFAIANRLKDGPAAMVCATLSHGALLAALVPGAEVSVDDGKIWARVTKVKAGQAVLEVTRAPAKGGRIRPGKGVNLPGADLRVDALTPDDLSALDFVVQHADIVAYSFVQTVEDVRALIAGMQARVEPGAPLPAVLLKIETPLGLHNLPDLIVEAGGVLPVGVMIARGDLAVEIGFDRLSEIQEEILWLCEAAQVPVVWATQVLEGMVKDGQASRAEVTDAAMSQRAECVMLNKGPHVVAAVAFLRGILGRMDRHHAKKSPRLGPLQVWRG
ncbi:pyruvate kinase [Rhodobacter ferrooxidans]|uniref:Pyruvate kinase n=1 Tax=Rhodobacter ferrooxidans TaxID=371731 RepID=C8S592_9RHOB|nr:pyruvate kinase [Rhodobacter sp. SW2]EEW23825.1 Pyruvate kinase [Rhodobacter sp. SW2]